MNSPANTAAAIEGLLALLQLGRRAREAGSAAELAFVAVNETRGLLDYRQAALWVSTDARHVAAVSGVAQPDPAAPYLQWLERVFRHCAEGASEPKRLCAGDLPAMIGEEWGQWLPRDALLVPLLRPDGSGNGVLLLARANPWRDDELGLAAELGRVYGHALFALRPRDALLKRVRAQFGSRKALLRIAAAVVVLGLLPVHLSVLVPAEVTPTDPFVVRAPLEGVIDRFQVQPNQTVAAGAPLFNLDTTALKSRHATAREAYATAQEQYRQSAQLAVTDDKAKLEMAIDKGTLDEKAVELAYTASELDRVQVKAQRAGVAVFSDVQEWTGRAVSIGQKVLVLADPAKVELTARMPVGDQIPLQPGGEIVFYPKAAPFSSYRAVVDSIAYHAEPDDDNVLTYRIRAHFAGAETPRLGLMGSARAYAGRVPLAYLLLRRPLAVLRQWLGW
jgi:multidrug resistance efflux pump